VSESKEQIHNLMNEYCYRIDAGDLEGFAALFEDSVLHVLGDPSGAKNGSAEVLEMLGNVTLYDDKPLSKHVLSNVTIHVNEDEGIATAQSYVTVYQAVPPDFPLKAIFIGHYHDEFVRTENGWRFHKRTISPDLIGDLSFHRADMA
jgi:3-phenylpropionate/cinnamic acid dioxygenase small subunit